MFCPVESYPVFTFMTFEDQVTNVLILAVPATIGYTLWRVFVTNRRSPQGGYLLLGLDESSATYLQMRRQRISHWTLALYFVTSFATFNLGLLAFDTYQYVKALLWVVMTAE